MYLIKGVRCSKCGEEIFSMHRHDFAWCRCRATGIDGGGAYMKVAGEPVWVNGEILVIEKESAEPQVGTAPDDWVEDLSLDDD